MIFVLCQGLYKLFVIMYISQHYVDSEVESVVLRKLQTLLHQAK
jgi:hypothetical protein